MEAAMEGDFACASFSNSRNELYPLGDFIPCREKFVGRGTLGCLDCLDFNDERVELDYFLMTMEHVNRKLTRDMGGNGRDGSED